MFYTFPSFILFVLICLTKESIYNLHKGKDLMFLVNLRM